MVGAECSDPQVLREARRAPARGRAWIAAALAAALAVGAGGPARAQAPVTAPIAGELLARAAAPDPTTRIGALASLQAQGTLAAWNLVLVMLQRDLDGRVREAAALALGTSRDPQYLDALDYAAHVDPIPEVRAAAAQSWQALRPFGKRVKLAAGLSMVCPGCGYFYLGRPERALTYLGGVAALVVSGLVVIENSPLDPTMTDNQGNHPHVQGRGTPLLMAAQNLWFYGVYATYRDARLSRGDGGHYPVAREDLGDLLLAPFNPQVLKKPWVWAGVPLMLGAAVGFGYLVSGGDHMGSTMRSLGDPGGVRFFGRQYSTGTGFALGEGYNLSLFLPVGVGEEALFRGVVQAGLSETSLGLWGGWALGSAIFGSVHVFNFVGQEGGAKTAALAVPYLIVTGSYLGYIYIRTNFSLLAGAAAHFWYDFLLSTLDFIADPDNQPFVMRFGMPF